MTEKMPCSITDGPQEDDWPYSGPLVDALKDIGGGLDKTPWYPEDDELEQQLALEHENWWRQVDADDEWIRENE